MKKPLTTSRLFTFLTDVTSGADALSWMSESQLNLKLVSRLLDPSITGSLSARQA